MNLKRAAKFFGIIATITVMSCGNNPKNTPAQESGPITMNLYYTGVDGNAVKFVQEMESQRNCRCDQERRGQSEI